MPAEVRFLEFGLKDACALGDLPISRDLIFLQLSGPIHGLEVLEEMKLLRTFYAKGGVDVTGLRSESLVYINFEDTVSMPEWAGLPHIQGASIVKPSSGELGELGELTQLTQLKLSGDMIKELPDLSRCKDLKTLELNKTSIEALPSWIGELTNLKELEIKRGVHTLPTELARLELEALRLYDLNLKVVPELQGKAPKYVSLLDSTLPDHTPVSAYSFLKCPSRQQAAQEFAFFLKQYPDTRALDVLQAYLAGDESVPITEAIVAVTRVHVDDEHGPSTNKYLCKKLGECGGEVEQAANNAISGNFFGTQRSVDNAVSKLADIKGIDADVFREFCEEMMAVDAARGLR